MIPISYFGQISTTYCCNVTVQSVFKFIPMHCALIFAAIVKIPGCGEE